MNENHRLLSFEDLTRKASEAPGNGRSAFYYRAHARDYLQVYPGGTAVPVTEASVRAALVIEEVVPDKKSADQRLRDAARQLAELREHVFARCESLQQAMQQAMQEMQLLDSRLVSVRR